MLTLMPEFLLGVLHNPSTDPALAQAGQSWHAGDPSAPPAGAATVVVATGIQSRGDRDRHVAFADVWIATRGLRFAAEAAVEFMALARRDRGPSFAVRVGPPPPVQHMLPSESRNPWEAPDPRLQVALRVRAALAAAPDDVYAETVSALAGYRDAGAFARVATSVLAPTQTAWVEQDLAEAIADKDEYRVTALLTAVATPEQATAISTAYASTAFAAVKSLPLLTTFVDGVGPAAVPALLHWLDSSTDSDAESRRRVLSVVAALPGDQAMRGLVDRADQKYVQPALLAAAGRFPARALRLLADSATRPTLAELLTAHVLAHPDVVARVLPELTPETARRIEAITGAAATVQEAPVSALPPLLADPPWLRRRRTARPRVVPVPPDGVAKSLGAQAGEAVDVLLATDPLELLPARIPALPDWAVPALLPPLRLRDGSGALPAAAASHVLTALAMSKPGEPYAGVDVIRAACTPESLAEFGWGLFRRWQGAGLPAKDGWVLDALGLVGDDETVRRLTPIIQAWPGEGGHAGAVTGVQVLATIGTDVALMHLFGVAQRARFGGLKSAAEQQMAEVATALGLSPDQLADRLVPDFGLAADGSMTLDYGPRQFVVGFDEQLRPYAADATGKRLKALPKPGARDDAQLAPVAYTAFSALKKDVRAVAADQIRRLERAMVSGRRWSGQDFRTVFLDHPLLWHIVRHLVWACFDESGAVVGALRVAEDRTFADAHDEPAELADDAVIGVAHPLQLGETVADWAEVFADYEILQPFAQLGREVYRLTAEEAAGTVLTRFEGLTTPATKVIGLERRGWRREDPQDSGHQGSIEVAAGRHEVVVWLDPGINVGDITLFPEHTLRQVWVHDTSGKDGDLPLSTLSPVLASEVIRDLTEVTS
jgi:hypothetical protein